MVLYFVWFIDAADVDAKNDNNLKKITKYLSQSTRLSEEDIGDKNGSFLDVEIILITFLL